MSIIGRRDCRCRNAGNDGADSLVLRAARHERVATRMLAGDARTSCLDQAGTGKDSVRNSVLEVCELTALRDLLSPSRLTYVVDIGANPLEGGEPPYLPMLNENLCHVT